MACLKKEEVYIYINYMFGPIDGTRGRRWGVGEICMLGGGGGGQ